MLEFQKQILTEIVGEDGLLVTSPGLGLFPILCSFVQLYTNGSNLVLLLNTTKEQDDLLQEHLISNGVSFDNLIKKIEYNTLSDKRSNMYRHSGIFSITSRILAVDMLLERIPISLITGIIVYNAHRVKPNSMEELILRVYREHNQEGFIKAFSDKPEAFVHGFAPLQNAMKSLQLRKVHIWPRFQVDVNQSLSQTDNNVIELRQNLTEAAENIQQNLVHCMEETLVAIRRGNSKVDVSELNIENSFFKSFDALVRRQLDPIWHQVSSASKQLVGDLKILRQLLEYLTTYDCVSFYSFIETIIAANSPQEGRQTQPSPWLLSDSGSNAIKAARKRVFLKKGDTEFDSYPSNKDPDIPKDKKLVLEEQPKWGLLKTILNEIEHDSIALNNGEGAPVLIMVTEKRTCSQLKHYITTEIHEDSHQPFLKRLAKNYFKWNKSINRMQPTPAPNVNQARFNNNNNNRGGPPNKRRRVRGGSSSIAAVTGRPQPNLADTFQQDIIDVLDNDDDDNNNDEDDTTFQGIGPLTDAYEIERQQDDILPTFEEISPNSLVTVQCYDKDINEQILQDTQPRFIIMFDPNPSFVRQIEVYRASHPSIQIRVYFMMYENSVEEQSYLSLIRKEKESFEKLIHEKSIMAIPLPDKRKQREDEIIRPSTRIAGGQIKVAKGPQIITVDMREFRSSLPPILYAEGIKIEPYTLQVGDYILSPDMCVERKSIQDLIQSFTSGRLYTQCESMSAHYKTPILLIEFDQNKSFSLQAVSEMKENIRVTDISSKLVLLTIAFPKLRIIWSSSPHETAKVFRDLKQTIEEPDSKKAASIGAEEGEDGETIYNMTPQDILRSMPGITSANYKLVMEKIENLEQLMTMSEKKLSEIIGIENGRKLHQFINKK